jgi:hypothetical protein
MHADLDTSMHLLVFVFVCMRWMSFVAGRTKI